nr:class I tRNA ligase family protein [Candidatus Sigynarchaeota archaeon]
VVNGIVSDELGRTMSKSLKNIIDPWTIFNNHGADAIRFYYYVSGPPHKEKSLSLESVRLIVSQFITKYWNSFKLFSQNAESTGMKPRVKLDAKKIANPLDAWMLRKTNITIKTVRKELEAYDIYPAAAAIQEFVDNALSNWYLRLSRKRFVEGDQDVYDVTYYVFDRLNRLLAPFVPFVTEKIFLEMQGLLGYAKDVKSVHLLDYPAVDEKLVDESALEEMKYIELLVQDMRATRDSAKIKTRQPVKEYMIHFKDADKAAVLDKYKDFLQGELNFKDLAIIDEKGAQARFSIIVKLNPGTIGRDFKKDKQQVEAFLKKQDMQELAAKVSRGSYKVEIGGSEREITQEHVQIQYEGKAPYVVRVVPYGTILLNTEIDPSLEKEGLARDFIRNVQNIRKRMDLSRHKECIIINIPGKEFDVAGELGEFVDLVKKETGCTKFGTDKVGTEFPVQVGNKKFKIHVKVE